MIGSFFGLRKLQEKRNKPETFKNYNALKGSVNKHSGKEIELDLTPLSDEQQREIQHKLLLQKKKQKYTALLYVVIVLAVLSSVAWFITNYMSSIKEREEAQKLAEEKQAQAIETQKLKENYKMYLVYAEEHFAKKEYKNSIYQYTEALKIHPEDTVAIIGLTRAYVYYCVAENENCTEAADYVSNISKHSSNKTLQKNLSDTLTLRLVN